MRVLIAGGGSGGHIYPALSIIEALKARVDVLDVLYVGTNHGMEHELVPKSHVPFATIHAKGLLVKGLAGKVSGAVTALRGLTEAMGHVRRFRPDVVVGTGGYVSGPVGLAALIFRIPLVLQEQNVWPGLTNRMLGPRATKVIVPFPESEKYFKSGTSFIVAPNPVNISVHESRTEMRAKWGIRPDQVVLMATGGSQGAEALNHFLVTFINVLSEHPDWVVYWATGKRYYKDIQKALLSRSQSIRPNQLHVHEYFYDIQQNYRVADVFFGRAGAMSIADCLAFGLPAVLVPSPHVTEDHQTKNAQVIADRDAGILIPEPQLMVRGETELIAMLSDSARRVKMSSVAMSLCDARAGDTIAATIIQAARKVGRR